MTAKVVCLKLPSKPLAHIRARELRRHLKAEVLKLQVACDSQRGDGNQLMDVIIFLLNSPLFLYTIGPRIRSANRQLYMPRRGDTDTPATEVIEPRHLRIVMANEHDCCLTQLCYGASVLVDARELARTRERNSDQQERFEKSFEWFSEEIEFLGSEYRAREQAAAEILGRELVGQVKSKVVRLKVGNRGLASLKTRDCRGVLKEERRRSRMKLLKGVVEW